ncbi:MAG: hypothetical protein CML13_06755 [Puniceicoccaceae bacterium]|nr:hypothetical protein [Puniceicoccaceae bacterium]|tara:strand:- start:6427 stop:7752 length:1326 start_codon:yes stop_codon:yes gene_type:complete
MSEELRSICQRLKPLIGDSADALWIQYELSESPVHKMESAHMIRMMGVTHLKQNVTDGDVFLTPSSGSELGDIRLGEVLYPGREPSALHLRTQEFTRHIGIFATSGAGKTNCAFNILRQLHRKKIPFMVIDWKRSYRNLRSAPAMKDLKVYTVGRPAAPFDWNPLRPPPKVHPQTWIQILAEVLEKTHASGQGVADVLIEHADKEFAARGFYDNNAHDFPNFYDIRNRVDRSRYGGRRALWRDSCLRILRTFTFGPAAEAFNMRQPLPLESLLQSSVVLELDMELPKAVRTFLSEVILRWIHLYRLGQGETPGLRHVLLLEEAHNIFPARHDDPNSGLENIYREIRSFGQGLIAITQHASRLPIYLLGNTGTLILMSLTHEADIMAARQALFLKRGDEVYLDYLKVGEGIVKVKNRIPACHVRFPLVPIKIGLVKDEDLMK